MTGGAAREEQWPECALCGALILDTPISLSVGMRAPQWFCDDTVRCRFRALDLIATLLRATHG